MFMLILIFHHATRCRRGDSVDVVPASSPKEGPEGGPAVHPQHRQADLCRAGQGDNCLLVVWATELACARFKACFVVLAVFASPIFKVTGQDRGTGGGNSVDNHSHCLFNTGCTRAHHVIVLSCYQCAGHTKVTYCVKAQSMGLVAQQRAHLFMFVMSHVNLFSFDWLAAVGRASSCKNRLQCAVGGYGVVSKQLSRQGAGLVALVAHSVCGAHLFPLQVYGYAVSSS